MTKKINLILLTLLLIFSLIIAKDIPFDDINSVPSTINATMEQVEQLKNENFFGKYISICVEDSKYCSNYDTTKNYQAKLKLFNLITIKRFNIDTSEKKVYLGGNSVGFALTSEGVIVLGNNNVRTINGDINTLEKSDIKVGDIITSIEDVSVNNVDDISSVINDEKNRDRELKVILKRKQNTLETKIKPALDVRSQKYKLGLWVKNELSGVGTLTYIRADNNRFGALGHAISDIETKTPISIHTGKVYKSNIIGVQKGRKGVPGELKGLFLQGRNEQGEIDKNINIGVFGKIKDDSDLKDSNNIIKVGGRFSARPGKAKIRSCVNGNEVKEYDVEIIKTNYQSSSNEKSLIFKVVDKQLLSQTGGIVQGMSGSPIIQDGKLIGAVTHVFISDPAKGFGIYIDWMINE